MTQDVKAVWRPFGLEGHAQAHAGLHHDQYKLENPTWNAPNWLTSPDNGNNTVSTYGRGKTETWALLAAGSLDLRAGLEAHPGRPWRDLARL